MRMSDKTSSAERAGMRGNDGRPFIGSQVGHLSLWPALDQPARWLPRHGRPYSIPEWISQKLLRSLAYAPIYTLVIVCLIVLIQVRHPWGWG